MLAGVHTQTRTEGTIRIQTQKRTRFLLRTRSYRPDRALDVFQSHQRLIRGPLHVVGVPPSCRRQREAGSIPLAGSVQRLLVALSGWLWHDLGGVGSTGGGDGEALVDWVFRAYESGSAPPHPALIVFGPFMPPESQSRFVQRAAALDQVEVMTFDANLEALMDQAVGLFRQGELQQALELLAPLQGHARSQISQLRATLMEIWNRNQVEQRRLVQLVEQERWWEALDSLNKLDHPWWQQQAHATRLRVENAIQALDEAQEHQQHPTVHADVISGDELDAAVEDQLRQGLDPWTAFSSGCSHLGGRVEEDGPESFCRRSSPSP